MLLLLTLDYMDKLCYLKIYILYIYIIKKKNWEFKMGFNIYITTNITI